MPSRIASVVLATELAIGFSCASLQPVWAQAKASDLFGVAPSDHDHAKWLTASFHAKADGWREIWRRSLAMGATLAPFLDEELDVDKDRDHRLVLIGAYSLAAQEPHTVLLGKKFAARKRDRFMIMFALALGARQTRGSKVILGAIDWKRLTELEQIVTCMALARSADRGPLPRLVVDRTKSPGMLAAALYCRPDRRSAWIKNRIRRFEHRDLVWRGYLLGDSCSDVVDADRTSLALAILAGDRDAPAMRREAAWCLAHSGSPASILDGLDLPGLTLELRLLLCHSKAFRGALLASQSTPQVTEDRTLRRRWFALYSRWAPVYALKKAVLEWKGLTHCQDVDVQRAIGLALAERLMLLDTAAARAMRLDLNWLMRTEIGPWLRVAVGETLPTTDPTTRDGALGRALKLLLAGQLPRERAARELRRASWRDGAAGKEAADGSNPGLAGLALHRQLLGELLIDGSVRAFVASGQEPYQAAGLGRQDTAFHVAIELFKFIRREEPWSERQHRLQN